MERPKPDEYDAYYETYVGKVPRDRPLDAVLREAPGELERLLAPLAPEDEVFAYADGKWTIREVLGHILDCERLFAYRTLHVARGDSAELPGMDQDVWAATSNADDRPVSELLSEFRAMREGNAILFASFDEAARTRRGIASGFEFSVRALVHIIAGHELHHRGVLVDRYLNALENSG